jgi:CheY-like chemotaxis protein
MNYNFEGKIGVIAEDTEDNYLVLKYLLQKSKIKLLRAKNGKEAVEICENHNIDLVLMDLEMPVMNGYEATEKIKELNKNVSVIAQTALLLSEEASRLKAGGFDDCLQKPISTDLLYSAIEKCLYRNSA